MNCDDVFVILTRGPFPSGSPYDAAVERHLQRCAECHRLAEALRPNDSALCDSTGEQELSSLPGYWGTLVGAPTLSLKDTADFRRPKRATPLRRTKQVPPNNLNVGQFAAAVALGIVLAAALRTLVTATTPKLAVENVHSATLLPDRPEHALDAGTDDIVSRQFPDALPIVEPNEPSSEIGNPILNFRDAENLKYLSPKEQPSFGTRGTK